MKRLSTSAFIAIAIHGLAIGLLRWPGLAPVRDAHPINFESPQQNPLRQNSLRERPSKPNLAANASTKFQPKSDTAFTSPSAVQSIPQGDAYFQQVRSKIESHLRYPLSLQRRGIRGSLKLKFLLTRNQAVESITLDPSSGHSELDQLALEALKEAQPLPSPPPGAPNQWTLVIPIEFQSGTTR